MHQEKYFNKPFEFIPERFLPEGKARGFTAELDPLKYFFGYGRR
jgi:cytochrome P450